MDEVIWMSGGIPMTNGIRSQLLNLFCLQMGGWRQSGSVVLASCERPPASSGIVV